MRTGALARKLGMSRVFLDSGRAVPVTVLQMDEVQVVGRRTADRDGYAAVQLGAGTAKPRRVSKAMRGHFSNAGVAPKQVVHEFRVADEQAYESGTELGAHHFAVGQFVDVSGVSKGKGFAGVMKRHGFSGLRASHGVSINHRSQGSTGQCQDPGRVFKGKKMAGQLGATNVTVQNLEVMRIDPKRGIVMVKGAVPGAKNSWVAVQDAVKKAAPDLPPVPEPYVEEEEPEVVAESPTPEAEAATVAEAPAVDADASDDAVEPAAAVAEDAKPASEAEPAETAEPATTETDAAVPEPDAAEVESAPVSSESEVAAPPSEEVAETTVPQTAGEDAQEPQPTETESTAPPSAPPQPEVAASPDPQPAESPAADESPVAEPAPTETPATPETAATPAADQPEPAAPEASPAPESVSTDSPPAESPPAEDTEQSSGIGRILGRFFGKKK